VTYLEAVSVATDEAGVAAAITAAAGGHDTSLRKDAAAAIVSPRESDGVLVVVGQVEMPGEPAFNLMVLAHSLDKQLAGHLVVVV